MTNTEMQTQLPTVLFVHGSWHQPSHFAPCRKVFEAAGYPTSCPLHPSLGQLPPMGLKEDAQRIRDELKLLVDEQGKDVIVVAHSYGGVVTTEGVDEAFAKKKRIATGKEGGVQHIVYMCAFMLPLGLSLAGAFDGSLPPFIKVDERKMCKVDVPIQLFYHDVPLQEQQHWVDELRETPACTQYTAITQAAYLYHPVTYLYCENDAALPIAVQESMVKRISESYGIDIGIATCPGSHSPYLSMPERVLEVVKSLAI